MGMSHRPPAYDRKLRINYRAIAGLRKLSGSQFAHYRDGDLGNLLDRLCARCISEREYHIYYELTRDGVVEENLVCSLDFAEAPGLSAVGLLRAEPDGGHQLLTVLDPGHVVTCLKRGTWTKTRQELEDGRAPLRVKMHEAAKASNVQVVRREHAQPKLQVVEPADMRVVSWLEGGTRELIRVKANEVRATVEELVEEGVDPASVEIWERSKRKVKMRVEID